MILTSQVSITRCLEAIEQKLNWGPASHWTHQDFLSLSERILEETGQSLSYITLKRVWGKVKYESKPTANTLQVLALFLGYENWRAFEQDLKPPNTPSKSEVLQKEGGSISWNGWLKAAAAIGLAVLLLLLFPGHQDQPQFNPDDFHFSSSTVIGKGLPNSVVFQLDASKSPFDSVEVQQSWDASRRVKIPKTRSNHTSIYYFPGFYQAKLVVGGAVVKEHEIHILSDDWYAAVVQEPVPVYLSADELRRDGKFMVTEADLSAKALDLQPVPPIVRMGISADFENLHTDNFVLQAKLKHTFREGSAACQLTYIYLIGEGSIMKIPLVAKGCVSEASLRIMQYYSSGKEHDLSAFGVDFSEAVTLEIISHHGKVAVKINGELACESPGQVLSHEIKAIDFRFQGLGEIEEVKLGRTVGDWILEEDF